MSEAFVQLQSSSDEELCFCKTVLDKDDNFELTVADVSNNRAWKWCLRQSELESIGKKVKSTEVSQWARDAFLQGSKQHFFAFTDDDRVIWKRSLENSEMRIRLGVFNLHQMDANEAKRIVLCGAFETINSPMSFTGDSERTKALEKENTECQARLEELVKAKDQVELTLYQQFLPVLQTKQKKIRQLMGNEEERMEQDEYEGDTDKEDETS